MSSKGSVNLEKALCASTQTKNHYRMFCLKRQCIKNWHDSVMEIIAWAQDHFQKSLLLFTPPGFIVAAFRE